MTRTLEFTKAHLLSALHDQLVAAGYHPCPVEGEDPAHPYKLRLGFPDDFADDAGVAAVVAAHDRAAALAAWQADRDAEAADYDGIGAAEAALQADIARLEDSAQALSAQVIRNHLARTDRVLCAVVRELARRRGA